MKYLTWDEQKRVNWVLAWLDRMTDKYGATVYEKNGKTWDWGQALCRECYGEDWNDVVPETPAWNDIGRAKEWENGDIPEWVDTNLTKKVRV